MHLLVLINPGSGTRSKKQFLREVAYQCFARKWSYEVRSSWYINDPEVVKRLAKQTDLVVIICGGDGTINRVIKSFWTKKLINKMTFFLYPGGTFNALVKNTNYSYKKIDQLIDSIASDQSRSIDLLELTIKQGKTVRQEICHTGVLFVKDCRFTEHAAQIQKALHQFDFRLGMESVQKSLPYLDQIKTFTLKQGNASQEVQAFYIGNNPYLITQSPIHSAMQIDDGRFDSFHMKEATFFDIGRAASVLLVGRKFDLPFLKHSQHRSLSFTLEEAIDMNLDGDVERLKKGTEITIQLSKQGLHIGQYL